jgi:hypothetical protein
MLPFRTWRDKVIGGILEIWKTLFPHSDDSFVPAIQKIVDDAIELKTQIIKATFVYRFVWADWGLCPTRFSNYLKIENAVRGGDISKVLLCLFPSFISLDLSSGDGRFQCLVKGVVMTENDRYSPDNISENACAQSSFLVSTLAMMDNPAYEVLFQRFILTYSGHFKNPRIEENQGCCSYCNPDMSQCLYEVLIA